MVKADYAITDNQVMRFKKGTCISKTGDRQGASQSYPQLSKTAQQYRRISRGPALLRAASRIITSIPSAFRAPATAQPAIPPPNQNCARP